MGIFNRFFKSEEQNKGQQLKALNKTSTSLGDKLKKLSVWPQIDQSFFAELLVSLITADVGVETAEKIITRVKEEADRYANVDFPFILELLEQEIVKLYQKETAPGWRSNPEGPDILLLVGVNGSGKTTTLAKLANQLKLAGNKVLIVAADTFRAAAGEQLNIWADRIEVDCISAKENTDPASVVVDGCRKAKAENYDCLICDTAGRLQNKTNLMNELAKIKRVAEKELGEGIVNVYLVIDATTGQNGLSQAQVFLDCCEVNGIILTKVDGTAKGGIILAIKDQLNIEVCYLGSGEKLEDFSSFNIEDFAWAFLGGFGDDR